MVPRPVRSKASGVQGRRPWGDRGGAPDSRLDEGPRTPPGGRSETGSRSQPGILMSWLDRVGRILALVGDGRLVAVSVGSAY